MYVGPNPKNITVIIILIPSSLVRLWSPSPLRVSLTHTRTGQEVIGKSSHWRRAFERLGMGVGAIFPRHGVLKLLRWRGVADAEGEREEEAVSSNQGATSRGACQWRWSWEDELGGNQLYRPVTETLIST